LRRNNVIGQLADGKRRAVRRDCLNIKIDPSDLRQRFRHFIPIALRPFGGFGQRVENVAKELWFARGKVAVADIKKVGFADLAGPHQDAAAVRLADGEVRIPNRPSVDAVAGERGGTIRGSQIDRRNVRIGQVRLFKRNQRNIVRAGTLGEADVPALEIRQRVNRRLLLDQYPLSVGDRLPGDIDDGGVGGLRENRRRISDLTDIDAAGVHRLKHRRP